MAPHRQGNKSGAFPVHIIYLVSGKREYFTTGAIVFPEQYDNGEITALATSIGRKKYGLKIYEIPSREDAKRDNDAIMAVIKEIRRIEDRYRLDGKQ
ncbi:hypothetical protein A8C56_12800 [Niabella ginsenosidivorans]|uniref:Arm DNA-binding domain-containing protein n=1 Tax=Niabella ginsenosidivorans TaxID=1176587 RepID=A0A1A9I4Z4_9BACT|nr:hypothetical protein [Niabella ginsenosidivorans]ANH81741.1 hypothetical protein A8C56_12800 [Niabella ginsenosidivorans]